MEKEIEKTTNENALVVASTELNAQIFEGESKVTKATSLDLTDDEQADMLLNAMSDVDYKLNDEVGKVLEVIGHFAQEIPVETINEETGEVLIRKKHTLMLFTKDGKSHVTGSNACFMSYSDIISIKGTPTVERPLFIEPVKVDAKEKGHTYLKLKIAKNPNDKK